EDHTHETAGRAMTDPGDVRRFALAGNARITLSSERTGVRYTYRIQCVKDSDTRFFVSLLTGPDNGSDYAYIGMLSVSVVADDDDGHVGYGFRTTRASRLADTTPPVRA